MVVLIPLDCLSLISPGSFEDVNSLKVLLIWEAFSDDFWVKYGIIVKGSPQMPSSFGIKGIGSPMSKENMLTFNIGCKRVFK